MLAKDENELLTRVGPGTPCGELLRRYWQPVCLATELTDERSKKRIKVMGEELVIFLVPPPQPSPSRAAGESSMAWLASTAPTEQPHCTTAFSKKVGFGVRTTAGCTTKTVAAWSSPSSLRSR